MRVEFTTEARDDLFEGVDYYESKEVGLGLRFRDQITDVLRVVITAPYLWRERTTGYRRVNCPVFPYYIAYVVRDDALVVGQWPIACANLDFGAHVSNNHSQDVVGNLATLGTHTLTLG